MKSLLLPLLASLALPSAVDAKEVINSQFSDVFSAASTALTKSRLECFEKIDESYDEQYKNTVYKDADISNQDLSDPLVTLLSDRLQVIYSRNCDFDQEKAREIIYFVIGNYEINLNPNNKKIKGITLQEFAYASKIFAISKCRLEKGAFQSVEEYSEYVLALLDQVELPQKFIRNEQAVFAGNKLKNFLNEECKFDISEEKINENIIKYFKEK